MNKSIENNVLYIYCRVSTSGQVEHGFSLEAQEKEGIRKAKQLGFKYEVYREEGASAATDSLSNRPVLTQLLEKVSAGEVTSLFVTEQDRLSRSVVAMETIKAVLIAADVTLYTVSSRVDFTDTEQEFVSDIFTLLSKRENTLKSRRSKRGLLEAALQGKWSGGVMIPFGYSLDPERHLVIDEDESEVVIQIFKWNREGYGTRSIANKLNNRGVLTRGQKVLKNGITVKNKYTHREKHITQQEITWAPNTVYHIIKNPIYKGERRYKGQVLEAPAIVSVKEWGDAQEILKGKKKNAGINHHKHFYLLKGLCRCGNPGCGHNLYGKIKTDERTYGCSSRRTTGGSCGLRSINLDRLEQAIWDLVLSLPEAADQVLQEYKAKSGHKELMRDEEKLDIELQDVFDRRERLLRLYENGQEIDLGFVTGRLKSLEDEAERIKLLLDQVRAKISATQSDMDLPGLMKMLTARKSLAFTNPERWGIVRRFIKEIIVNWCPTTRKHIVNVETVLAPGTWKTIFVDKKNLSLPPVVTASPQKSYGEVYEMVFLKVQIDLS